MRIICDLEANGLKPSRIWVIACKDVDTEEEYVFDINKEGPQAFLSFSEKVTYWIGHNFLGYDREVFQSLLNLSIPHEKVLDTLVVSRLLDANITGGHGLEAWGTRLGYPKPEIAQWDVFDPKMIERCQADVRINFLLYKKFKKYIESKTWKEALETEHFIHYLSTSELRKNGFAFDLQNALLLKKKIEVEISSISSTLLREFLPKVTFVTEVLPRGTKFGTISKSQFRFLGPNPDLSPYTVGAPFSRIAYEEFNPGSHKQRQDRLWEAGWAPINKTKGHKAVEKKLRELRRQLGKYEKRTKNNSPVKSGGEKRTSGGDLVNGPRIPRIPESLSTRNGGLSDVQSGDREVHPSGRQNQSDLQNQPKKDLRTPHRGSAETQGAFIDRRPYHDTLRDEITHLEASLGEYGVSGYGRYGWTTDEENLHTLPETAPKAAQTLVRWLLLSNRVSTLTTWIEACEDDSRIHGSFNHIGAWTGRMSHDRPNMGNIPKFDSKQPDKTPYSDQMRALWKAGDGRYLVGVDAESIQLRIFGHYLNDDEFIAALLKGDKKNGTDPHSVNQRALGPACKSRDDSKTFIYAWLLGAGIERVAGILGCTREEAKEATENFLRRYTGLKYLKEEVIPDDAARGYFKGFDGRYVRIRGDDYDSRRHFCLGGYLQNGESTIMKRAVQLWYPRLRKEGVPFWWVNFVHDEFQIETIRDYDTAKYVGEVVADSIRQVGEDLGLRCPMAGSLLSGHGGLAIGDNWLQTH